MRLPDTVALITGGGSGIGRAIGLRFAQEGAQVILADRYGNRAEAVAAEITAVGGEAIGIEADVADEATVNAMAEQAISAFGRVDVLVNNAGLSKGDDILEINSETWDLNLDVVLKGVFLCSKALLPGMRARGRGVILNIGSVNGLTGIGEMAYSAAKAGMVNLTQNLAVRHGPVGIRVNCIAPGSIRTPIWANRVASDPEVFDRLAPWYPLRRVGEPEDISNAALFLASDEASWITGVTLCVDGGLMAGSDKFGSVLGAT